MQQKVTLKAIKHVQYVNQRSVAKRPFPYMDEEVMRAIDRTQETSYHLDLLARGPKFLINRISFHTVMSGLWVAQEPIYLASVMEGFICHLA